MPRLFLGNFSFEESLLGKTVPAVLRRLELELSAVWLAVAEPGDGIICRAAPDDAFVEHIAELGIHDIHWIAADRIANRSFDTLIPWGSTPQVIAWAQENGMDCQALPPGVVRHVNSREFSSQLEEELQSPVISLAVRNLEELAAALGSLKKKPVSEQTGQWILKANLSHAGRCQYRGNGWQVDDKLAEWAQRQWKWQTALFVEPWLDSACELGCQWEIPQAGPPQLLAMTRLLSDSRGQYAGTRFDLGEIPQKLLGQLQSEQQHAVHHMQAWGYWGPVGIDAMIHQENGELRLRSVQDINARWTMGRMAWEWFRRLRRHSSSTFDENGCWLLSANSPGVQATPLSPEGWDGQKVGHRTWWIPAAPS